MENTIFTSLLNNVEVQSLYNAFYDDRITSNKEMENLQTTIDVNIYNDIFNCNEDYSNITITS